MNWTINNIPSLNNKVAIVTGANSGLGSVISRELSKKGAEVILAVRDIEKGYRAVEKIRQNHPNGTLIVMEMDLSSLESVRKFSKEFHEKYTRLDILMNNAGLMTDARGQKTREGFGLVMGVNHIGHFHLTVSLLDTLIATPFSRVVSVASQVYKNATINLSNFHIEDKSMYAPSKLANMLFTLELQRRLTARGATVISLAAAPGPTRSEGAKRRISEIKNPFLKSLATFLSKNIMHSTE